MSQLAYTTYQGAPFAGVLADSGDNTILSYINSDPGLASMPFGIAVAKGTNDQDAILLATGSSAGLVGIVAHTHQVDPGQVGTAVTGAGAPSKYALNVMTKGRMYVIVEEAVTPASPVFVRYGGGSGGSQKGAFRASADTATAVAWTAARYLTTQATPGGTAVVEINLP